MDFEISTLTLQLVKEFVAAASLVLAIPAALYIGCFYVHLSLLTKAGVHDALMTSAFQVGISMTVFEFPAI